MVASARATTSKSAPRATFCTPPRNPSTSSRVLRGQSSSESASVRRAHTPNPSGNNDGKESHAERQQSAGDELQPQRLRVEDSLQIDVRHVGRGLATRPGEHLRVDLA